MSANVLRTIATTHQKFAQFLLAFAIAVAPLVASPAPASAAVDVNAALVRMNEHRLAAGLGPVALSSALVTAAQGHADYYAKNGYSAHAQTPGAPGFTGASPSERAAAARYAAGCVGEVATTDGTSPKSAIDGLINTVAHRSLMLIATFTDMGFGQTAAGTSILMGGCRGSASGNLFLFPGRDTSENPSSFKPATETPNPLPAVGQAVVGAPVSIATDPTVRGDPPSIVYIAIADQFGESADFYPITDPAAQAGAWAYFLPKQPLKPGQKYSVSASGTSAAGQAINVTWSFFTESAFNPEMVLPFGFDGPDPPPERDVWRFSSPEGNLLFYTQTAGRAPVKLSHGPWGIFGFRVTDAPTTYGQAPFLTEFQAVGGVSGLGYPISNVVSFEGKPTQFFQRGVLQWQPQTKSFNYLNIIDLLDDLGHDAYLDAQGLPGPGDQSADAKLPSFDAIVQRHLALLDAFPQIRQYITSQPEWQKRFGLPMNVVDRGDVIIVRAQRAGFQLWRIRTDFAMPGEITIMNAGDFAKAVKALLR